MKSILAVAVLSTLGLGTTVSAAEYTDIATVISSTPVYERVSAPRRECVNEQVSTYDERRVRRVQPDSYNESRNYSNSSESRQGSGAGAVIGGLIGHSIENDNRSSGSYSDSSYRDSNYRRAAYDVERVPVTRDVQRCNVVNDYREEVRGYDVRYRYGNREYTTRLAYDPGQTMPVNVDVRPSYRQPSPSYGNRY